SAREVAERGGEAGRQPLQRNGLLARDANPPELAHQHREPGHRRSTRAVLFRNGS
ncbi:hypothetical protein AAVH_43603, partial [Aphelenchoides avenae]